MRWLKIRANRERGATAVVMALLITGLVGLTGLAVDGAATMAKYQELQNGADAAALAAAAECGLHGCSAIDAVAGPYGVDNVTSEKQSVGTAFEVDLSQRTVKATVTGTKTHWFLPVVGVGSSGLSADATASWGFPTAGTAIMPLAFSLCQFEEQGGASGASVTLLFTKTSEATCVLPTSGNTVPGGFAYITDNSGKCGAEVSVDGWVDSQNGNSPKNCTAVELTSLVDQVVLLPVFDECRVGGKGNNAPGCYTDDSLGSDEQQYKIHAFAAFRLEGLHFGGQFSAPQGNPPCKGNDRCVRGAFIEYVSLEDSWTYEGNAPDLDALVVTLID